MLRRRRRFDAILALSSKSEAIAHFFSSQSLHSAVIGVSGGIDSALVFALMATARKSYGYPKRILPVALPCPSHPGATGQDEALARAKILIEAFHDQSDPLHVIDMRRPVNALYEGTPAWLDPKDSHWAIGQLVSYARTPALYHMTSLLAETGEPACVVGTTNRDEGAWLGYVGKAADGMVDFQPISDLHKSEVRALAGLAGVPGEIISACPTGDMFDGRTDEELFGAPYDFIELYLLWETLVDEKERASLWESLPQESQTRFTTFLSCIEKVHRYNAHKYLVGSPSIHIDLWDAAFPGGRAPARHSPWQPLTPAPDLATTFANPVIPPPGHRPDFIAPLDKWQEVGHDLPSKWRSVGASLTHLRGVLAQDAMAMLLHEAMQANARPADRSGRWSHQTTSDPGSYRFTWWDEALAHALWEKLRHHLPPFRRAHPNAAFDAPSPPFWKLSGINPAFRGIRYEAGGELLPHVDAPQPSPGGQLSLMSLVLYLETSPSHPGLVFHDDPHLSLPTSARDFSDSAVQSRAGSCLISCKVEPGDLLVFDHRLVHSVPRVTAPRLLLRSDVMAHPVGP